MDFMYQTLKERAEVIRSLLQPPANWFITSFSAIVEFPQNWNCVQRTGASVDTVEKASLT